MTSAMTPLPRMKLAGLSYKNCGRDEVAWRGTFPDKPTNLDEVRRWKQLELRQLIYFLAACQHDNHGRAAKQLGISASTLSEAVAAMESELGLRLFLSSGAGYHPTVQARLIFQDVDAVVRQFLMAELHLRTGWAHGPRTLKIRSPLRFSLGRLSRAVISIARSIEATDPSTFHDIRFQSPSLPPQYDMGDFEADLGATSDIVIDYQQPGGEEAGDVVHLDSWVALMNFGALDENASLATKIAAIARSGKIMLPAMPSVLAESAHQLAVELGLPMPEETDLDGGSLIDFALSGQEQCLLAPESAVSRQLSHRRLNIIKLPGVRVNPIVAVYQREDADARRLVQGLKQAISAPELMEAYVPSLTRRQFSHLLAACDHPSLTAVARKLHVTQPAVSNQLRKVERLVGRTLFTRAAHGTVALPAARNAAELVDRGNQALARVVGLARRLANSQKERLVIGMIPLADGSGLIARAFARLLSEWRAAYPAADVRILVAPTSTLHLWMKMQRMDFALIEGALPNSRKITLNSEDALGVVTGSDAGFRIGSEIALREASKLPMILPTQIFGLRQMVDRAARSRNIRIAPTIESDSLILTLELVRGGRLATIMPYEAIREGVDAGELKYARLVDPVIRRQMSVIYSAEHPLPDYARAFIALLREHLARLALPGDVTEQSAQGGRGADPP